MPQDIILQIVYSMCVKERTKNQCQEGYQFKARG